MHVIFGSVLMCADAVYQKLSKLVHACRNYSLPKLARCLDTVYAWSQSETLGRRSEGSYEPSDPPPCLRASI